MSPMKYERTNFTYARTYINTWRDPESLDIFTLTKLRHVYVSQNEMQIAHFAPVEMEHKKSPNYSESEKERKRRNENEKILNMQQNEITCKW